MPSVGQSALICSPGRSPITSRSIGPSHPSPRTAKVPSTRSSIARILTRGVAALSATTAASTAIGASRHDTRADDPLVALQADLELLEVSVRLAAVEHDAVQEIVLRRAVAVRL